MNQENNNLNQDSFNTQVNNGVPNNQPLNNQNFNQNININQQPINPQPQATPSFQQPIGQMNTAQPIPQPINNFESGNSNNESLNSKPPKKNKAGLIIGIVIALIVIIFGIIIVPKLFTKNENTSNNGKMLEEKETNSTDNNQIPKLVVYLNDLKIILGQTTMDEIVKNTDLKVLEDETSKYTGCTSKNISLESEDWIEYDKRIIKLSDGINTFVITSYFEKTNVVGELTTLATGQTNDPEFNSTKGTKLTFEDNTIGRKINIGDSFSRDEYLDIFYSGYCISGMCPQTGSDSNDMFLYYFDSNYKLVNMSATLMSYYG